MFWKKELKKETFVVLETPHELKKNPAGELLKTILGREFIWLDKSKMSEEDLLKWSNEAKALLENRVFQSLVGQTFPEKTNGEIVKNLIEHLAKQSRDWQEVLDIRSKIVGIELIREYAEGLLLTKNVETFNEINEAV